jgi:hypothetical protein
MSLTDVLEGCLLGSGGESRCERGGEPRGEAMRELGALLKRALSPSSKPDISRRFRGLKESVAAGVELVLELGWEEAFACCFMTFMTQGARAAVLCGGRHVV